jgi:hypothetical protein
VHREHEAALRRIASSVDPWPLWTRVKDLPPRFAGQGNRLLLWDEILQHESLRSPVPTTRR